MLVVVLASGVICILCVIPCYDVSTLHATVKECISKCFEMISYMI